MKERLLLKIVVTEENDEGCNIHSECPVSTIEDGLILSKIFGKMIKRNPFFAAAMDTALIMNKKETAGEMLKDILASKTIEVKQSKTQS